MALGVEGDEGSEVAPECIPIEAKEWERGGEDATGETGEGFTSKSVKKKSVISKLLRHHILLLLLLLLLNSAANKLGEFLGDARGEGGLVPLVGEPGGLVSAAEEIN